MFHVAAPCKFPPDDFRNNIQEKTYTVLEMLCIPYERVDTDEAITAVTSEKWYRCSDGTTTGYMKIKTEDLLHRVLPY